MSTAKQYTIHAIKQGINNWLLIGYLDAGQHSAFVYWLMLLLSCKQYGKYPLAYLLDVLTHSLVERQLDLNTVSKSDCR
jgi:hypothetical protein